jgi:hypothetical protein
VTDPSFSHSKCFSQIKNSHGSLHRLRLRFVRLFKGALLRNL